MWRPWVLGKLDSNTLYFWPSANKGSTFQLINKIQPYVHFCKKKRYFTCNWYQHLFPIPTKS